MSARPAPPGASRAGSRARRDNARSTPTSSLIIEFVPVGEDATPAMLGIPSASEAVEDRLAVLSGLVPLGGDRLDFLNAARTAAGPMLKLGQTLRALPGE